MKLAAVLEEYGWKLDRDGIWTHPKRPDQRIIDNGPSGWVHTILDIHARQDHKVVKAGTSSEELKVYLQSA